MLLERLPHQLGVGRKRRKLRSAGRRERPPDPLVLAAEERDGRRPAQRGAPPLQHHRRLGADPRPRYLAREAEGVQPQRIVVLDPRGKHIGLPCRGGQLAAVELVQHRGQALRALHLELGGKVLPPKEKAHAIRRAHRLDLAPQPVQRVAMDAREQPALAPLEVRGAAAEMPAEHEALALQRGQRRVDRPGREVELRGQLRRGRRAADLHAAAHQLAKRVFARPAGGPLPAWDLHFRIELRVRVGRAGKRHPLRRDPEQGGAVRAARRGPPGRDQRLEEASPLRARRERARHGQRVVQLVRVARIGPRLAADPLDGGRIERPKLLGGLDVERAARDHGLGAPLLERGVVQERIDPRVDDFVGHRRRLGRVERDQLELARGHAFQDPGQARQVHRLDQAVLDRLVDQRMVRDFPVAGEVLRAGRLVGEHRRDQVVGFHALQRRGHPAPAALAEDGQGARRVPAPARRKDRRVEHRLDQQLPHRPRVEIAEDVLQREAVLRPQREHDGVLGGRGLQLEVEPAAETLAERQAPGAVDPAAERRVQHELHPAGLVEEALQHQRLLRRHDAERLSRGGEILDDLPRGRLVQPQRLAQPRDGAGRIVQAGLHVLT